DDIVLDNLTGERPLLWPAFLTPSDPELDGVFHPPLNTRLLSSQGCALKKEENWTHPDDRPVFQLNYGPSFSFNLEVHEPHGGHLARESRGSHFRLFPGIKDEHLNAGVCRGR